ncbi:MAG TPA: type II CAAX endopeptidase family protein [Acidimicrobiia bacterium]|nr:type II CAAX endopeptidase family protein [Acidimicrobiia bacterium]
MVSTGPIQERQPFTVFDFLFAYYSGFVGALAVAVVLGPVTDGATLLVASLVGHHAAQLLGLAIVLRRRNSSFGGLGLHVEPSDGVYLIAGVVLQIAIIAAFIPVARLIGAEDSTQSLAYEIPNVEGTLLRAGLVLSVALVGPVTEELLFRGLLPRVVGRWTSQGMSFVVAAFFFAVLHLVGVTTDNIVQSMVLLLPQLFIIGLILGWQTMRRRRLGVAIFTHAGFNLVAVLVLLFAPETFG